MKDYVRKALSRRRFLTASGGLLAGLGAVAALGKLPFQGSNSGQPLSKRASRV